MARPKYTPPQRPQQPRAPVSVIAALETAVLLLEQSGYTEEMIFGLVNCCLKGFIRGGEWAPEYLTMVAELQKQEREDQEAQQRLKALHESISSTTIKV